MVLVVANEQGFLIKYCDRHSFFRGMSKDIIFTTIWKQLTLEEKTRYFIFIKRQFNEFDFLCTFDACLVEREMFKT